MPKIPIKFGSRNKYAISRSPNYGHGGDREPFFSMSQFKQQLNITSNLHVDVLNSERDSRVGRGALGEVNKNRIIKDSSL